MFARVSLSESESDYSDAKAAPPSLAADYNFRPRIAAPELKHKIGEAILLDSSDSESDSDAASNAFDDIDRVLGLKKDEAKVFLRAILLFFVE